MELFFELLMTIASSLLLSFAVAKILSLSAQPVTFKHGVGSEITRLKSERMIRISGEAAEKVGFEIESKVRNEKFESVREVRDTELNDHESEEVSRVNSDDRCSGCSGGGVGEAEEGGDKLFDESLTKAAKFCGFEISMIKHEEENEVPEREGSSVSDEVNENEKEEEKEEEQEEDDDDWEGIERTELDRVFSDAVVYVESKSNAGKISNLGSDLKRELYGLHKIAIQGPCGEPQPMALKLSARAKWNAWQQLGNISPEAAMERYINLLSENIPDWMHKNLNMDSGEVFSSSQSGLKTGVEKETCCTGGRSVEISSASSISSMEMAPCLEGWSDAD